MNRRWLVTHLPSQVTRETYAPSGSLALQLCGWPPGDCTVTELPGWW